MSIQKIKEWILDLAWKKIAAWAVAGLIVLCGTVAAVGQFTIDAGVRSSAPHRDHERRIEDLEVKVAKLAESSDASARMQMEFNAALMDAFPQVKSAVVARVDASAEAAKKRAADSALLHQLGSGK